MRKREKKEVKLKLKIMKNWRDENNGRDEGSDQRERKEGIE